MAAKVLNFLPFPFISTNFDSLVDPLMCSQVKSHSSKSLNSTSSDAQSKDSSSTVSEEEKEDLVPSRTNTEDIPSIQIDLNVQPQIESGVSQQPEAISSTDDYPEISELHSGVSPGSEEGWQPVQRPRSSGLPGQKLRHKRTNLGKIYTYQKKEANIESSQYKSKESYPNSAKYYFLKKKTTTSGHSEANFMKVPSSGSKFGRNIRSVTYRVKYVPAPNVMEEADQKNSTPEPLDQIVQSDTPSSGVDDASNDPSKSSQSTLLSYKDVALAPPGTVAKLPARKLSESSVERDVSSQLEEPTEPQTLDQSSEDQDINEETKAVDLEDQVEVASTQISKATTDPLGNLADPELSVKAEADTASTETPEDLPKAESCIEAREEGNSPKVQCPSGPLEMTNRKLSALAAPFSPSSSVMRGPVVQNIRPVPGVAHWPIPLQSHPTQATILPTPTPICSVPLHPYPTSPRPPSVTHHPVPFGYPSYSQAPPVPNTMFPMNTSMFHPNHFAWNVPEFVPGTMWPPCHPSDFPIMSPVVAPIPDPVNVEPIDPSAQLPEEEPHCQREIKVSVPEDVSEKKPENKDSQSQRPGNKNEGEGSLSIFLRGRGRRKQTLRMPLSLLNKPFGGKSFKVIYHRVVRGNDSPKPTVNVSTDEESVTTQA